MSSTARARARTARSKRSQRATGAAIVAVLLVIIGIVAAIALGTRQQYRVTNTDATDLIKAISSVPKSDVSGADPIPRPPGSVRSYYMQRGRVTTIVYVSKQPTAVEKPATLDLLARGGWATPANLPPGKVATEADSYTAVFANKTLLLQLALTRIKDITSVTYIIQGTT